MPHQLSDTQFEGKDLHDAKKVLVLLHGRGSNASGILPLAKSYDLTNDYAFVAPNAKNNTWYPYSFMAPVVQNQPYLDGAIELLSTLVQKITDHAIKTTDIHFMGFSQGACLAAEFLARQSQIFGSLHIYSGGLIGQSLDYSNYADQFHSMPVFIGCSDIDAHIPLQRVHDTAAFFEEKGAKVDKRIYPNAPHSVFQDEIDASKSLFNL